VDGGAIAIPNYGAWVPGEWVVEGRGAVPDVEVDQDPTAVMAGKDPQLDKAIEIILDGLKSICSRSRSTCRFPSSLAAAGIERHYDR